ncbi:uncharacterized protein LOC129216389 [Uloborus diversus]|uniref:uncharacterized protein LOC129216389 n=1 Tax=Uloborus diversus TaxID=327109 RepID=UPI00240A7528|nr:uncharacterized protein LOC129216389 [Uloborus diversus]
MDPQTKRCILICLLLDEEESDQLMEIEVLPRDRINPIYQNRESEGAYNILIDRHLWNDTTKFREYFRLTPELFNFVLDNIASEIASTVCNRHKKPISPSEKLALTLRYISTGESLRSLAFGYRIKHSWISHIVREVLQAIVLKLMPIFLPEPSQELLEDSAAKYHRNWNFPNCCGAIDGKHMRVVCPKKSGSCFYNYKGFFSVVLLGIVGPEYKFIAVDVGSYGREGDAGIFPKSKMGQKIISGQFPFPLPSFLPHSNKLLPHVLLGDSAFALTETMMKPYPVAAAQKNKKMAVFNYRLSRARRTSENAFGILCQVFRIFFTPIPLKVSTADLLIMACCILHNMLRDHNIKVPCDGGKLRLPTKNMKRIAPTQNRRSSFAPSNVREVFSNYFMSKHGRVPWQDAHVNRTG